VGGLVGVVPHTSHDDAGELSFVGSPSGSFGLVLCRSAGHVCLGFGVAAGLGDVDDVQHGVDPAVAAEVEAVAPRWTVALSGGHRDRGNAAPAGEASLSAEPVRVADVGEQGICASSSLMRALMATMSALLAASRSSFRRSPADRPASTFSSSVNRFSEANTRLVDGSCSRSASGNDNSTGSSVAGRVAAQAIRASLAPRRVRWRQVTGRHPYRPAVGPDRRVSPGQLPRHPRHRSSRGGGACVGRRCGRLEPRERRSPQRPTPASPDALVRRSPRRRSGRCLGSCS